MKELLKQADDVAEFYKARSDAAIIGEGGALLRRRAKETAATISALVEELEAAKKREAELRKALEYIQFSCDVSCTTYNGKDCDKNTQDAYHGILSGIKDETIKALQETEDK